ncbi:recombinase family protein [Defluviimonas sp. D31]|uniref:recombinase family protein n=1 Tax=Defluviimonas sp. D31 TaxID=3083253 RepID=UPI00296FF547|nr:recombinase family protein [Defluviimonas sp. D31]MDW4551738.1 recombinase family protein [Defluviimonas sp. D31]
MQREASIEDQVRICRRLVEERGWRLTEVYSDMGMSGASHLRPGFQRLLEDGRARRFDVVVAESIDRISRDQEHIAGFHKQMTFNGVVTHTVAEGAISELHIGLKGTMGALFLKDLAQKTHRGLEGRVRAGKSAGGISYGYRLDRQPLPYGSLTTGDRAIDAAEAAVVRRIFVAYAGGESARAIAIGLNAEGVPGPRSSTWSFSTISGNWKRGTGILNNELYIGRLVWNRQHFVKDPATGKRQARPNPPGDWIAEDVPELRIIDDELWQRVKLRQGAIRDDILAVRDEGPGAPRIEGARRTRYLLSGLLACGCCGAGYIMISDSRYGCSAARNRGTCTNRRSIKRAEVEERVLAGLKDRLMAPELVEEFLAEYQREAQKERQQARAARGGLERELARVEREIANVVTAITQGMFHPAMKAQMDRLEAQKAEMGARLAAVPEPDPVALHPGLYEVYRAKVEALAEALNQDDARAGAAEILRGLIEKIVIHPTKDGNRLELYGELGAILSLCGEGKATNADAHAGGVGVRQVTVVAGVGFEPTTFRL